MSDLIRLAPGQVTAYELLSNDNYLVKNWARVSDMTPAIYWSCSQPETGMVRPMRESLEVGVGKYVGMYAGDIQFFLATPLMRSYLEDTILGGNPKARVTGYFHTPHGFKVLSGELLSPYVANAVTTYSRFNDTMYSNNVYRFQRGVELIASYITQVSGDNILLANGTGSLAKANQ